MAQSAPIAIMLIIGVTFAFMLVHPDTSGQDEKDFSDFSDPNNSSTFGFQEDPGVFGIVSAIWDVVTTFFDLLTFNVPGAPAVVRFPVGLAITGSLAWSIASLIRG